MATPARNTRYGYNRAHNTSHVGAHLQHYDDDRLYNITVPRQQFQLGGFQLSDKAVPRGREGMDAMERDLRDLRAAKAEQLAMAETARRQNKGFEQRLALDRQIAGNAAARERQRAADAEADLLATTSQRARFGPVGAHDERAEAERKRRRQAQLREQLEQQQRDKAMYDAMEQQHFAAAAPDWDEGLRALDDRIRKARMGDTSTAVPINQSDAEKAEAARRPKVLQDMRESAVAKKEDGETPISAEVANFADRILIAERARREGHERYRAELDSQVQDNFRRRQQELTLNLICDRSYHIGASNLSSTKSISRSAEQHQNQSHHGQRHHNQSRHTHQSF